MANRNAEHTKRYSDNLGKIREALDKAGARFLDHYSLPFNHALESEKDCRVCFTKFWHPKHGLVIVHHTTDGELLEVLANVDTTNSMDATLRWIANDSHQAVCRRLSEVEGHVSITGGIATLPDGTTIDFK